jgi:hypothetical protein
MKTLRWRQPNLSPRLNPHGSFSWPNGSTKLASERADTSPNRRSRTRNSHPGIALPPGIDTTLHACGVDDDAGFSILFPGWVTSIERYWVTSGEQRSIRLGRSVPRAKESLKPR